MIDFLCIGPTRTGTTWLHDRLSGTFSLPGPHVKETKFFDLNFDKGLTWYESHMRIAPGVPRGEFGPTYFHSHLARKRVAKIAPGCTIIAILREPVSRLFSLYKMRLAFGTIRGSFEDALRLDPELIGSALYAFNLSAWASVFGTGQVHVLFYDSLLSDSRRFVRDFCNLCGTVPPELSDEALRERVNDSSQWREPMFPLAARLTAETGWKLRFSKLSAVPQVLRQSGLSNPFVSFGKPLPELTPAVANRVRGLLTSEISALEALLNIELPAWRKGQPNSAYADPVTITGLRPIKVPVSLGGRLTSITNPRAAQKKAVLALPVAGAGFSMERYGHSLRESLQEASDRNWTIESFRPGRSGIAEQELTPGHVRDIYERYVSYPLAARRLDADLVHIVDHGYGHLLLALKGVRTVVTCHDVIPWLAATGEIPLAVSRRVQRSVVVRLRCLKLASHVVAVSNNTKADLIRLMPELDGKTSVVYPGVSSAFRPAGEGETREQLRARLAIAPDAKVLLHVGQASYKNIGKLIELLSIIKCRIEAIKLIVTAPLKAEVHAEAQRRGVADIVSEAKAPDDTKLIDLYRASDVFVFPSWYEGFGWPPLEAMACGLPVVSSRAGSLTEVLGDAALLCNPSNTKEIADAAEQLIVNRELANRQIAAGIRRAAAYTWEETARQMLAIYGRVAETPVLN
jgi:glycosyltransferase involved in cell wall biosynthesis